MATLPLGGPVSQNGGSPGRLDLCHSPNGRNGWKADIKLALGSLNPL